MVGDGRPAPWCPGRSSSTYADWLRHPYYLKVSKALSDATREANEAIVPTLDSIERVHQQRSQ